MLYTKIHSSLLNMHLNSTYVVLWKLAKNAGVGFIFLHKTIGSEKVKNPKSWWASETVTTESKPTPITSAHRRNLLPHLGSEKKGKSKAQKPASPSLSSWLSSSDEEPPPPKKSGQKQKAPELKLSHDALAPQPDHPVLLRGRPNANMLKEQTSEYSPTKNKKPKDKRTVH